MAYADTNTLSPDAQDLLASNAAFDKAWDEADTDTDFVRRLANEVTDFEDRVFDADLSLRFHQETLDLQKQDLFEAAREACQFLSQNPDTGLYGDDPLLAPVTQICQNIEHLQGLIAGAKEHKFRWQVRLNAAQELLAYYTGGA